VREERKVLQGSNTKYAESKPGSQLSRVSQGQYFKQNHTHSNSFTCVEVYCFMVTA
jgi:hypothetical protein